MTRWKAWSTLLCRTGLVVVGITSLAWADEGKAPYLDGSLRKLGRGIANLATCPAELVRTPELVGRRDGTLAALTVGIAQGIARTILRGVTGLFEVATFYAEVPKNFGPLMKPEFVWQHGDWAEDGVNSY